MTQVVSSILLWVATALGALGYTCDDRGRPTTVVLSATDEHPVTQTATTYDALGRRVAMIDQEGKVTRHRYDGLGRLIEVRQYIDQSLAATDADLHLAPSTLNIASTRYSYDAAGNQQTQTDALGRVTSYWTDSLGRRTQRMLPKDASESAFLTENLLYDEWGNMWKRTDFAGKTTTFGYDTLNRLMSKTADATHPSLAYSHAIAQIEFDYDANGSRTAARTFNASNIPLYTESTPRDERGRLDYKDTAGGLLDYGYHANNRLKDVVSSNPGGVNIGYRYDEVNRLEFVDDTSTGLPTRTTGYTYNANGSLATATAPNGVVHTYTYDTLNRLRGLSVANLQSQILRSYTYNLRPSGHRREVVEGTRTVTYTYDGLYRLTGETITGDSAANNGALGYTIDQVGNRSARTSTLGAIGAQSGLTFNARDWQSGDSYDSNGNTIAGQLADLAARGADVYDFENRLILRTKPDGSSVNVSYDADGNRCAKNILNASAQPVSLTTWLVDTNNLTGYAQVAEERVTTVSGTTLRVFTYGHSLISQAVSVNSAAATLTYFGTDGFGTVRQLTDASGTATDAYDYDAFGVLTFKSGVTENAYRYSGEQYDADLGLYYLRARYLNTDSGRFWSMDDYEGKHDDPHSLHKYAYASANPVTFSDPTGHFSLGEIQMAQNADSTISKTAVPNVARLVRAPIYSVYYGFKYAWPFGHSGIFVGSKIGGIGWLFHVVVMEQGGKTDAIDGGVERRPMKLEAFRRNFTTVNRKFTEFSQLEFTIWVAGLRLIDAADESLTPAPYQMMGLEAIFGGATNCHKWAFKAAASAVLISRKVVLK